MWKGVEALVQELTSSPIIDDQVPLTTTHLQQAVSYEGGLGRLRSFLAKLRAGENFSVAVLGGSVSAGSSSRVRPDQSGLFHRKLQRFLLRRFSQSTIGYVNAAMPAVPPGYMEQCLSLHVPPSVDLVLLEGSANMCGRSPGPSVQVGDPDTDPCEVGRQSVERMLRQILRFPTAPAVVFVHAFPYWTMKTPKSWYQKYQKATRGGPRRHSGSRTTAHAPLSQQEQSTANNSKHVGRTESRQNDNG